MSALELYMLEKDDQVLSWIAAKLTVEVHFDEELKKVNENSFIRMREPASWRLQNL